MHLEDLGATQLISVIWVRVTTILLLLLLEQSMGGFVSLVTLFCQVEAQAWCQMEAQA